MRFLDGLFFRNSVFDEEIQSISSNIKMRASQQAYQKRIHTNEEADRVAKTCALKKKMNDPQAFVDIALLLCQYPPELGSRILTEFQGFKYQLGFDPCDCILTAIAKIPYTYSGIPCGFVIPEDNQKLMDILHNSDLRARKAGQILSRYIFFDAKNLKDVRRRFFKQGYDTAVIYTNIFPMVQDLTSDELFTAIRK